MEIGPLNAAHHLRLAYAAHRPSPTQGPQAAANTRALDRSDAVSRAESARARSHIERIVAAEVPGRVSFDAPAPKRAAETLPMYHHPAQRNAVATDVTVGRTLDVSA
ncbi:MAG: hypothetical protein EA379_02930 [Phycisphaerales bacterium]|nr:MAG: hypothetical protein EA379_02930 [Phycisphaerales bacterium]